MTDVILIDTEVKTPLSAVQEKSLLDFLQTDKVCRSYYDEIVPGTGLRISEFCGLTRQNIDLEASIIVTTIEKNPMDSFQHSAGIPRCGPRMRLSVVNFIGSAQAPCASADLRSAG